MHTRREAAKDQRETRHFLVRRSLIPLWLCLIAAAVALLAVDWYFLWKPRADQVSGDTLIHLIFARNCVDGRPFEFNLGFPSRALTAPLWNWFLAFSGWITGTAHEGAWFLLLSRILTSLTLVAALALVWRLSRRLGATVAWAAVGVLILLTNPSTFYWTVANPMETAGAALLTIAFLSWAHLAVSKPTPLVWAEGGLLAVAGFLMRPELIVFAGLAAMSAFFFVPSRRWINATAFAIALAAGLAAWMLYLHLSGLAVLPNAGSARRLMLLLDDSSRLPFTNIAYSKDATLFLGLFAPFLIGTLISIRRGDRSVKSAAVASLLIAGFSLLFFTFYFPTTWQGRYLLPTVFALTTTGVAGLSHILSRPYQSALLGIAWSAVVALVLIRPLSAYADAPRQRSLPQPAFLTPPAEAKTILCQEIQSAWFYPRLFHICTEGLIGLEALDARKRDLTVKEFILEQHPDLIGVGRYPLRDPEGVSAAIFRAGKEKTDLSIAGLQLTYLGEMAGCGPVFTPQWTSSLPPRDH